MSFGDALAQGIMSGLGQGISSHTAELQRERMDKQKTQDAMDAFKQQYTFKSNMENIQLEGEKQQDWDTYAKKSNSELVRELVSKQVKGFKGTKNFNSVVQSAAKNYDGWDKPRLLNALGKTQADYSRWEGKEEYADAIPKVTTAGHPDMPGMDSVFTYNRSDWAQQLESATAKATDWDKTFKLGTKTINDSIMTNTGHPVSDRLASLLYNNGQGMDVVEAGANRVDAFAARFNALHTNGQLALNDAGKWDMVPKESETMPEQGVEITPKAEYIEEEDKKAESKRAHEASTRVGKNFGKAISSYGILDDLDKRTMSLSKGAQKYLYGGATVEGLGVFSDKFTQAAAKLGDKDAQEAAKYLAYLTTVTANLKHEQYGATQSAKELEDFASQLGRPGMFQNPQTLSDQINARKAALSSDLQSQVGVKDRDYYLADHPSTVYLNEAFGIKPETDTSTEKGQVSDTTAGTVFIKNGKVEQLPPEVLKQYNAASPEKQQQFLKQYNLTLGS